MPFEIFITLISITIVIPIIAYIFRTQFPPSVVLALGGAIWLLMFFNVNNLIMGYISGTPEQTQYVLANTTLSGSTNSTTHVFNSKLTISSLTSSSDATDDFYSLSAGTNAERELCNNCSTLRLGEVFTGSSAYLGKEITQISVNMYKVNSPTGNIQFNLRDSSDNIKASGTFVASSLTTSMATYNILITPVTSAVIASGDRMTYEYTNTALATGSVRFQYSSDTSLDTTNTKLQHTTTASCPCSWADFGVDIKGKISNILFASRANDANSSTSWKNNVDSESNASIYADMGSAKTLYGIKLRMDTSNQIPSNILIYFSNSTTFTSASQLSSLAVTTGYQNIAFDSQHNARYVKIAVNSWGSATRWTIGEYEVWDGASIVSTTSGTTTDYSYDTVTIPATNSTSILFALKDNTTGEPSFFGIMFIVMGLMFMMIGALVEVKGRNE